MAKVPSTINYRGSKYALIRNGNAASEKNAKAFVSKIKKITGLKAISRKVDTDKYVVYLEGAKGSKYTGLKTR